MTSRHLSCSITLFSIFFHRLASFFFNLLTFLAFLLPVVRLRYRVRAAEDSTGTERHDDCCLSRRVETTRRRRRRGHFSHESHSLFRRDDVALRTERGESQTKPVHDKVQWYLHALAASRSVAARCSRRDAAPESRPSVEKANGLRRWFSLIHAITRLLIALNRICPGGDVQIIRRIVYRY